MLNIRKATVSDANGMALVHTESWKAAYKGIIPEEYLSGLSAVTKAKKFKANLVNYPNVHVYVLESGSNIIGSMALHSSRDEDLPNAGEIGALYLMEEHWGKGCGSEMIRFAISFLKDIGFNTLILWVLEENTRARRFYEKHGFATDGMRKEIILGKSLIELRYRLEI